VTGTSVASKDGLESVGELSAQWLRSQGHLKETTKATRVVTLKIARRSARTARLPIGEMSARARGAHHRRDEPAIGDLPARTVGLPSFGFHRFSTPLRRLRLCSTLNIRYERGTVGNSADDNRFGDQTDRLPHGPRCESVHRSAAVLAEWATGRCR
jgi:hypothetical protein